MRHSAATFAMSRNAVHVVLAVAGCLALLLLVRGQAAPEILLAVGVPLALLVLWLLGRQMERLVGPLFFCELVRFARRGRSTTLRFAYGFLLLFALKSIYETHFPFDSILSLSFDSTRSVSLRTLAMISNSFTLTILSVQLIAVVVLTPAYLAGAVAEEREKRTLDLLFTTDLSDREIIVGKLLGRLCHLGGIVLVGLPILALLQLWGGASLSVLLAGFAATALTLLSVGSVSILCSTTATNSLAAVLLSYVIVMLFSMICPGAGLPISPLGFILEMERLLGVGPLSQVMFGPSGGFSRPPKTSAELTAEVHGILVGYALVHGLIALGCLIAAVGSLRMVTRPDPATRPRRRPRQLDDLPRESFVVDAWEGEAVDIQPEPRPQPATLFEGLSHSRCPVTERPLLWKEAYHGAGDPSGWSFRYIYGFAVITGLASYLLVLGLAILMFWHPDWQTTLAQLGQYQHETINPIYRVLSVLLAVAWCMAVAWRSAGVITKEREQRTLAGLLVLPTSVAAIAATKWIGPVVRFRWLGAVLAALLTVSLLSGAIHPLGVLCLATAILVHVCFLSSLGLWVSMFSRNSMWAYLTMALVLLLMFIGPWIVIAYGDLFGDSTPETWWDEVIQHGLNPLRSWWFLGFSWTTFNTELLGADDSSRSILGATMTGVGFFALATGLMWLVSWQRLRQEQTQV